MRTYRSRALSATRRAIVVGLFAAAAAPPSDARTTTPSVTETPTRACGPTATPYCADHCVPCPTIRPNCYADACGECHENPVCAPNEVCVRSGFGSCCTCATATVYPGPSPTPTPPMRVDTVISGLVYDAVGGVGAPLAGAVVDYRYGGYSIFPVESGSVVTGQDGRFQFTALLAAHDRVDLTAAAPGFASLSVRTFTNSPMVGIGLPAIGGIVQIEPSARTIDCSGMFDVTITNVGPPGDTLVIVGIEVDGGFYFGWDLSGISFPAALASGENILVPVSFSGGESQLVLTVVSGAREGTASGTYLGRIEGCPPTPTRTITPTWTITAAPPTSTPPPGATALATRPVCARDCNDDGAITVEELISAVREALGSTPAGGCPSFDRDGDGRVDIDELIRLVLAALRGCALQSDLQSTLEGVYDANGTKTDSFGTQPRAGMALVRYFDGRLQVSVEFGIGETLEFSAYPVGEGALELEGGGIESGDIAFGAHGRGTVTSGEAGSRIETVLELGGSATGGRRRLALTLERPAAGTPSELGGTYLLRLEHDPVSDPPFESEIALDVEVPASGRARCGATQDVGMDDVVLAELPAGECQVSPLGRFAYVTPYDHGEALPIQLFGHLPAGDGGEGSFLIGAFPLVRDHGIWHAVKENSP
jgi:hypothetical protein